MGAIFGLAFEVLVVSVFALFALFLTTEQQDLERSSECIAQVQDYMHTVVSC